MGQRGGACGASLLRAREKRDAEQLPLLRQQQEIGLLDLVRQVRKGQVAEAKEGLAALRASRKVTEGRLSFYQNVEKISEDEGGALLPLVRPPSHPRQWGRTQAGRFASPHPFVALWG